MNPHQFAALIGFLFAAAWTGLGFGDAVLCLTGAATFAAGYAYSRGELDIEAVQRRLRGESPTR